jgi:hypothetical protein
MEPAIHAGPFAVKSFLSQRRQAVKKTPSFDSIFAAWVCQ